MSTHSLAKSSEHALLGRCFLHPFFDYLLIGGALSFPFVVMVLWGITIAPTGRMLTITFVLCNGAHFAASTVRLYTKPGATAEHPAVSFILPLFVLLVVSLCIRWHDQLGSHLWKLYLTWSPFHYAAQAFGLCMIYCYRSGLRVDGSVKRSLYRVSLLPFFLAVMTGHDAGLDWALSSWGLENSLAHGAREFLRLPLAVLAMSMPAALFLRTRRNGQPLPLIVLVLLMANSSWWVFLPDYESAWFWAAIFHSIQYLIIVVIFHANDMAAMPDNTHGGLYHGSTFYFLSVLVGVVLFFGVPLVYSVCGLDFAHAMLMTAAAINIHHFIVDGFIWRSKKKPTKAAAADEAAL